MNKTSKKIDLEKMSKHINCFKNINKYKYEKKKTFLNLRTYLPFHDDLNPYIDDFFDVINIKGNIIGYSGISKINNISENIASNIKLHNIKKLEHGFTVLFNNPKVSLFDINERMQDISRIFSEHNDFIFISYNDKEINIDEIKYFTIFTGVEYKDI